MTLYADLRVTRAGGFRLELDLRIAPGEVVALLGPNGAGKTTALRAIAGLLPLTDGSIRLGEAVWDEPPAVFRSADRRPIGVVFQDYLLFDHLSALENVAFGLRARGVDRRSARADALRWLETVGLAQHSRSRPRSGPRPGNRTGTVVAGRTARRSRRRHHAPRPGRARPAPRSL
jgi:molybdate transport system ATP-binding protein